MKYKDLRDFIAQLEQRGLFNQLIQMEIDPVLEMTKIADRTLRAGGPALLFENPKGYQIPVLAQFIWHPRAGGAWHGSARCWRFARKSANCWRF